LVSISVFGQTEIKVDATLLPDGKTLSINQKITFLNDSNKALEYIYLYDWINAFSDKNSALAQSFSEEFVRKFHFASTEERGGTQIKYISNHNNALVWKRPKGFSDIIQIKLDTSLKPGETFEFDIVYDIILPNTRFTSFGADEYGLKLKYWLLKPAYYKDKWYVYPHRRLYDMPQQLFNFQLDFTIPVGYDIISSLDHEKLRQENNQIIYSFPKQNTVDTDLYVLRYNNFETTDTEYGKLVTNIGSEELPPEVKSIISYRILGFLEQKLGKYPFDKLLVSEEDYQLAPVYGLNQLPAFIRPFPDGFQYDIKLIKTVTAKYLKNTILTNTRENKWMLDAIQIQLMMEYVDTYYKNMKLLGKLSDFFVVSWFHISDLDFNHQYDFLYKNVTRNNIHQSLSTPQDSLIKFNQKIANPYQAGLGLQYLKDYTSDTVISRGVKSFYEQRKLKFSDVEDFKFHLTAQTEKDVNWFFDSYTELSSPIDFSIGHVDREEDSLVVKIRNEHYTKLPVSLTWIKDKQPINKIWIEPFDTITKIKIPRLDADRLAVNYDGVIPEVNNRNNFKGITKLFNKPIQIRPLQDVENPNYSQLFVMPEFTYNLYDGISLGPKLYNGTFLPRQFNYKVTPKYGLNSGALIGSASMSYQFWQYDKDLFNIGIGANGSRFSYDFDLFYERYTAFLSLYYRDNENRRNNERQRLTFRTVNVRRDRDILNAVEDPDYNVFNIKYLYSNTYIDRFFTASVDYEIAQKFSKLFAQATFRRLYENNRQINVRLFAGTFLYNDTGDSDYFSFAIDRPTDYMFDYNYYGRSEESGLFSQQFIMAEGGFKSQLEPAFANEWLATMNVSTTIWNWIFAYGDAGIVGNSLQSNKFIYDAGIRFAFVEDFFELFLPIYSNNGWEFDKTNYDQRIRFIVSLDFGTLFKLFTRKWY
jgi:hypothetical protein